MCHPFVYQKDVKNPMEKYIFVLKTLESNLFKDERGLYISLCRSSWKGFHISLLRQTSGAFFKLKGLCSRHCPYVYNQF